jgi:SAM-dependent methyltransferase
MSSSDAMDAGGANGLPPDYSLHEGVYRSLRERNKAGWNDDDEYARMYELARHLLPAPDAGPAPRVLELGSGAGNFSMLLADKGYEVDGAEISPTAVAWANDRARGARAEGAFRIDNVLELSTFGDEGFDAVIDGHCLHCIIGEDRARCLAAAWRVLKPGGVLVVLTMCGAVLDERTGSLFDPITGCVVVDGRPMRYIGSADSNARSS